MREPRVSHSIGMAVVMLFVACHRGEGGGTTARDRAKPQPITRRACDEGSAETVDVNNDGRADIVHRLASGGGRRCSEVDLNFDGNPDLVRFYADDGRTVSFEQHDYDFDGSIDDQAYYQGLAMERKELDTNFDGLVDTWMWCKGPLIDRAERSRKKAGRVDTWEVYEQGTLAEVKYDENNDGVVEKWDTYRRGALFETRVDTNGDGKADRTDPAEAGGNETDERVSCDGSKLPEEAPAAPGLFGDGGVVSTALGDGGVRAADGGVPTGTDPGLSGAAQLDAGVARALARGTSAADAGPILRPAAGDAGR